MADEADAKNRLKEMLGYAIAQKDISFQYVATLEVVTKDMQRLSLASSGTISLSRPDKIRATRSGEFVDVETVFALRLLRHARDNGRAEGWTRFAG